MSVLFCPLTSAWQPQIEYLRNAAIMNHPLFLLSPPLSYFHPTTILQCREPHALLHNRPASISRLFFFLPQFFLSLPCFNLPVFHHFFSVLSLTSGAGQYELPTKYKWSTFLPNGQTEKHLFTSKNRPLLLFCKFFGDENEKKTFTKWFFSVFSSSCVCGDTEGC